MRCLSGRTLQAQPASPVTASGRYLRFAIKMADYIAKMHTHLSTRPGSFASANQAEEDFLFGDARFR